MCKPLRLEASDGFLCFHSVLHLLVSHDLIQAVKANSRECKEGEEGASDVYISVLGHGHAFNFMQPKRSPETRVPEGTINLLSSSSPSRIITVGEGRDLIDIIKLLHPSVSLHP